VLAVGGEGVVLGQQGPARAHLGGLLAEAGRPDPQLALSLQSDRLRVDPAGQHHVGQETLDLLVVPGEGVLRVLEPFSFGGEQLDKVYVSA
jgi:hypothetical protein